MRTWVYIAPLMRIVIVGGGVMGCATALSLSQRDVTDIVVLERAVPGAEASSAAAGMLAPEIESSDPSWIAAREAYATWSEELRSLSGIDIGFRRTGALKVARTEAELRELGGNVRLVDAVDAKEIEPELSTVLGAVHYPNEAQVDPPQLLRALVVAIVRAKVAVRSGTTVSSLLVRKHRCEGVVLAGDELLEADAVVLAAGSWSSLVAGVPSAMPTVRPIRGQMVQLEERPLRLRTIVFAGHGYVVPRGDGRVVCGSTMEDVGHRREVTAGGLKAILADATSIIPSLGDAEFVRSWCNFRPCAAGGAPLVGRSSMPGLFLATGHHRNGILLAKVTADTVANAIV